MDHEHHQMMAQNMLGLSDSKKKAKVPTIPPYVEGGYINDQSGKHTKKARQRGFRN